MKISKHQEQELFCIFGFDKHENIGHQLVTSKWEFLRLSICDRCERVLRKAYTHLINNGWEGNFNAFRNMCIGERLKNLGMGLCGCKHLSENEVDKAIKSLTDISNRYMRCDYHK